MIFKLTEEQVQKYLEWKYKHNSTVYTGPIGGRYTFSFTNTSLGQIAKVTDSFTKEELILTNLDDL